MPSVRLYVRTGRHLRRLHKILWDSWRASLPPACAGFLYGCRPPVTPITKISDTLHLGTFICRLVPGVHALTYESMRRWVEAKKKTMEAYENTAHRMQVLPTIVKNSTKYSPCWDSNSLSVMQTDGFTRNPLRSQMKPLQTVVSCFVSHILMSEKASMRLKMTDFTQSCWPPAQYPPPQSGKTKLILTFPKLFKH